MASKTKSSAPRNASNSPKPQASTSGAAPITPSPSPNSRFSFGDLFYGAGNKLGQ